MSDRQIFHAVKDGHPVSVVLTSDRTIPMAYVLGVDDYHWALIDHELSVHLVHKSVPCITVLSQFCIDRDTHGSVEEIRQRTAGFRESIMRDHFNHQQPAKEPA